MKNKIAARMLPHADKIDITTWELDAFDKFSETMRECIRDAANGALTVAIANYGCFAWFPNECNFGVDPTDGIGSTIPADHMTIYVTLPLGADEDSGPTWGFSLRKLVESVIDGHTLDGKIIVNEDTKCVVQIRDGLRELAQKIDNAIAVESAEKSE